ncbi:MAG: sodium-dependent transporter [Candidatus Aenigmarchaeota archaeon]|nr:sodium-dependent transporter [Candidatus Aenigmarchaeota archaeon]MCX8179594.1 sodium-dependent transporter [Candidatus Aenigmarchaeota archaeon]
MKREEWKSAAGFLLASIGSAVGLGSIWRFPYIFSHYGKGNFLFAYIISVIFFGLPLMFLEFASGRKFKGSVTTVFAKLNSKLKWLSLLPIIVVFFILSYYIVIVGWVFGYFINSFLMIEIDFAQYSSSMFPTISTLLSLIISSAIVYFGIEKGIERFSKIFMPLFFVILLIMFVFVLTLPNAYKGVGDYFKINFSDMIDGKVWLFAVSQALFSLSLGSGIMITYGSYLSRKENIPVSSLIIALSVIFTALLNSIIIFSFIHSSKEIVSGSKLAFEVMPKIFSEISLGNVMQVLFFSLTFIAGLTSAISMKEVLVAFLVDELKLERKISLTVLFFALLILSISISLNYSGFFLEKINLLEKLDFIFGGLMLILSSILTSLVLSWNWNTKSLIEEVDIKLENVNKKLDKFVERDVFLLLVRFILPFVLLLLLLSEVGI